MQPDEREKRPRQKRPGKTGGRKQRRGKNDETGKK
jgi:hypothetical protein